MKKKWALFLTAVLTAAMLTGCQSGNTGDDTGKKPVEQYVTLGEYKNLDITLAKTAATQEEVDALALQFYCEEVTAENGGIVDRPIQVGDTANIDYVGKKDEVAFSGGTASGSNLVIGSGSFIDGFEDGLVGVIPGETVDLNLTFPEIYQSEELAGQDVVFTVTVNFILPTEIEDEVVAAFDNEAYTNAAELKEYAGAYLEEEIEAQWQSEADSAILTKVMENAVFTEIPEELKESRREVVSDSVNAFCSRYGIALEDYALYYFNMDAESFLEYQTEIYVKQYLVFQAIANEEGLTVSDQELQETLEQEAESAGYESPEAYLGDTDKEMYRDSLMQQKAYNFILENNQVKAE